MTATEGTEKPPLPLTANSFTRGAKNPPTAGREQSTEGHSQGLNVTPAQTNANSSAEAAELTTFS